MNHGVAFPSPCDDPWTYGMQLLDHIAAFNRAARQEARRQARQSFAAAFEAASWQWNSTRPESSGRRIPARKPCP